MESGKLICVTGFYGVGKSTIVQAALAVVDNLEYLKTTTTRPPRPEEIAHGSMEYNFVSPEEYAARRAASRNWDHTLLHDYSYGADVDGVNQKLSSGTGIICCIAPDLDTIDQMSHLYAVSPVLIWIHSSLQLANSRLRVIGDESRIQRTGHRLQSEANAAKVKQLASIVFEPVNDLRADKANFVGTIQKIMRKE